MVHQYRYAHLFALVGYDTTYHRSWLQHASLGLDIDNLPQDRAIALQRGQDYHRYLYSYCAQAHDLLKLKKHKPYDYHDNNLHLPLD